MIGNVNKWRQASISLALAAALACGGSDSTSPTAATVAGAWTGPVVTSGSNSTVSLTLQQSGTAVTGNGALTGPSGAAALSVTGSFTPPTVALTITSPGFSPINYTATLTGNRMSGALNGSGFTNVAVTLTRQ